MRRYLQSRRLTLLRHITYARHRPIHTTPATHSPPNAATDLPLKNKSLLSFLSSTNPSHQPPDQPPPHHPSLSVPQTPSQLSLPQSPLLSPTLTASRLRHTTPKPRARLLDLSTFQRQLRQNPYANILATPVRQCALTGARLPAGFLVGFGLVGDPGTGRLWHLPRMAADAAVGAGDGRRLSEGNEGDGALRAGQRRTLSSTHFLSSARAIVSVGRKRRKEYLSLMNHRWKEDPGIDLKSVVWREDMAVFVRGLLRRRLLGELEKLTEGGKRARGLFRCEGGLGGVGTMGKVDSALWGKVDGVLWFGVGQGGEKDGKVTVEDGMEEVGNETVNAITEDTAGGKGEEPKTVDGPPPYAMLSLSSGFIPVYNVRKLLGEEHMRTLQEEKPNIFGGELTVIQSRTATIKLQQDLWRLMGYLSSNKEWVV